MHFELIPPAPDFGTVDYGNDPLGSTFSLSIKNISSQKLYSIKATVAILSNPWSLTFETNGDLDAGATMNLNPEFFSSYPTAPVPGFFTPVSMRQQFSVTAYLQHTTSFSGPSETITAYVTGKIVKPLFVIPVIKWRFPWW